MGGRGAKIGAKNGLKTVNQWLNEMQSGKFEFVKTKKRLKKRIRKHNGQKTKRRQKEFIELHQSKGRAR